MNMRRWSWQLLSSAPVFLALALPLAAYAAEKPSADAPLVADKIREAMQDRRYADAVKAIDQAAEGKDAPRDYLLYLKGRAMHLDGKYDEAIAVFDDLNKQLPKSPWARRARFSKAVSLARKGDFRSAELIYRTEAEYLLSTDRKQQIADIYLEFADTYFKPPKEDQKPDYAKALEFYKKALETGAKADKQIEIELLIGQCQQNLNQPAAAAALFEQFSKEHPASPLDIEARWRLGTCRLAEGNAREARRVWQDLLAKYVDSQSPRVADAQFDLSRTWNIPNPGDDEQLNLGTAALRAFLERFPKHAKAGQAHLEIAQSYLNRNRPADAAAALKQFLADPRCRECKELPEAQNLLGGAYQTQKDFVQALAAWRDFLAKYPAHNAWSQVQQSIVETEYLMALDQFTAKKYAEANKLFAEFLAKYPLDGRNPSILLSMNQQNVADEKWDDAIGAWRRLVSKYPGTDPASQAQFLIAETLERKLSKLEEALEEYRKVTWGSAVGRAQQAAARLTAKTMTVSTERVFRSDETPKLKLVTRNIESVTVRAYKVDLETYFRKMHLARGVEGLDISLIDPDTTFEFKVPKYVKHQESESWIEVGIPPLGGSSSGKPAKAGTPTKGGVMAVTVSSKSLEATTMVVQSDLDVIVKSSRDEVFIFAENMLTGKPWPGVRLLVSNGHEVIGDALTGENGVFQKSYKDLVPAEGQSLAGSHGPIDSNDIRVFAVIENNVASNMLNLQGVGAAQGLTDKGYIYTDRPAYRAGQLVNVRGCLRRAVDDAYVIDKDKSYTVEVYDARNRPIREEKIKLSELGSFHVHFLLPPNSPQGQYRVLVHDNGSQSFQGTFLVQAFQLEPIRLVVDTPRRVYYRGEPIEGTIRAEFYYGAPVVGREIHYQLAGDRLLTGTTDAKGEVHINLPTREYSESQVLPLSVQLPEGNVNTQVNFVLAAQGFSIGVSTVRPVYVSGESLEATVSVRDAENKPLAQKLTLKVLERTLVDGRPGERQIEEHELTTGTDGKARQTLKLAKGGAYFLRAEAIDRFHNPITGQSALQISGEDDLVRLRILADQHTYKVGDTAAVQLFWREAPALALVTIQGARVLDYRLVELKTGANKLEIPMTAALAPNFELAVAVMTDPRPELEKKKESGNELPHSKKESKTESGNELPHSKLPVLRFHTATSPFTVERDLRVKIATKKKSPHPLPLSEREKGDVVRPGDELEVTVTTTDPQGKPVAAELSLAMVEQSLLERFTSPLPSIGDFFRGADRQPAVRCTSSIVFSYRPATQPINPRLLAERDREKVSLEEEESRKEVLVLAAPVSGVEPSDVTLFGSEGRPMSHAGAGSEPAAVALDVDTADGAIPQPGSDAPPMEQTGRAMGQGYGNSNLAGRVRISNQQRVIRQQQSIQTLYDRQAANQPAVKFGAPASPLNAYFFVDGNYGNGTQNSDGTVIDSFAADQKGASVLQLNGGNTFTGGNNFTADDLNGLVAQNQTQVFVCDNSGMYRSVRLGDNGRMDNAKAAAMAAEFNSTGAILLSALLPQETGYWNPVVATSADGTATISLIVPDRSTAWKFLAKGLSAQTLAGEATDDLTVKKDLFGEIKLPLAFTDGDTAEIPVAVHNDAIDKGKIEVVLRTTIAGRRVEETKTIDATSKGLEQLTFKAELKRPERVQGSGVGGFGVQGTRQAAGADTNPTDAADRVDFEVIVRAAGHEDRVERSIPLRPYGVGVSTVASGSSTSDGTVWLETPEGMTADSASLQIIVGPTVERSLLDIVLAPAPLCQMEVSRLASGLESASSDIMASLGLQTLIGGSRDAGGPEALALDSRIRGSVSLLLSAQNDDGGWSWTGTPGAASNRYASCRIVWAVTLARKAGYVVPDDAYSKAKTYLQTQVSATDNADYESKAILLHVLAVAGQGDFSLANRLYRDRNSLSSAALVHLAMGLQAMDLGVAPGQRIGSRSAMASEVLGLLEKRNLDDSAMRRDAANGALPWSHSPAELRALYALALQEVSQKSPKVKELVDWLLAHRTGNRWAPEKATGPAALALCRWFADSRFSGERYKLTVFVNDVQIKVLDVDPAAGSQTIDVPRRFLNISDTLHASPANGTRRVPATVNKQRVNFQIAGRGRYTYQCILGGFVPADKLKSTTTAWRVTRYYEPAPLELDGREIPRGFAVLAGGYQIFRNPLEQLPVGRRGMVNIDLWRNVAWGTPEERLEYLVVTEPIPSGTTVIEKSVTGPFEHFEIGPGEITFYVGSRMNLGTIHYELYGYVPGTYRVGPTVVRNAHRPEQLLATQPMTLTVLPQGAKSADRYRLTPQELYELGKRLAVKKDFATATAHLTELIDKWNLLPDTYKEVVQMLLDLHLEIGPPGKVVHYFEIVKEKWPNEEIPFAKIVKVGAAYHELGEYERSYLVFRATVESNFARESEVAGFLQSQGELLRSVEEMSSLLRNYPPEGYVAAATYALAQQVSAKAPEAAGDAKLRQKKVNRVDLLRRAWTMLEGFLTGWPDDPAADQAAFASASTLLDLKVYREATAACERYAKRYAQSDLVDSYWYIIGYCEFATGQHKAALEMCQKVADLKRIDKTTGREVESPNKWQAIYILGQVYHGLGEAADAIREYHRVEDRFADAKEAIAYFLRKSIDLPEVTTVKPGDAAELELKFRNIAGCDVKVYRIDLMKFSLLRRNLGGIAQINLAGIRPLHETSVKLGDGKDYRDRTKKLPLPLKDEGAYLVVCRGDDLHASGLVLVTPLVVEIQEDAVSGRVRTTVKDVKADRYVNNVHVKVIGSQNDDFVAGDTDLRGIFVADGIRGQSTVIARADPSRYAFFRGQTELAMAVPTAKPAASVADPNAAPTDAVKLAPMSQEKQLLQGLEQQNRSFQGQQMENLKRIYDNKAKGVEIKAAY